MSASPGKNMAASVATRLLNRARARNEDYHFLLTRYAVERLLWRLAQSQYADAFILKGAMVFLVWTGEVHRPTKDLDLLAQSTQTAERLRTVFAEICNIGVEDDGLVFIAQSIEAGPIRDDQAYGGVRLTIRAHLGKMRIPVQIDVGFGDAVTPDPVKSVFPVVLEHSSAPTLRVYPREVSIAEKLDAMVSLGMVNSRMKDYYDIHVLLGSFAFEGKVLSSALRATFTRRGTELSAEMPLGLSDEFAFDPAKIIQWKAFRNKGTFKSLPPDLPEVISMLRSFLLPPLRAAAAGKSFEASWHPGGPWIEVSIETGK